MNKSEELDLRILHIVEAFSGGVVSYLQTLVNGMNPEYENCILYTQRGNSPKNPEYLFREGTKLIPSKYMVRELNLCKDTAALFEIRQWVKRLEPDIVHLHSSKAGVLGRWIVNGKRTAVFYTPNSYSFQMNDCGALKRGVYYVIEKLSGFRSCTTIACGKGEYEYAKRVSKRAIYISNAIDTRQLDSLKLDAEQGVENAICTMARISGQKNPKLFNDIARCFPQTKFVWIGDGEDRDKLTSPNIEITGWLSREDALSRMMECSIYLQTSQWEGLSFSLLEAMYLKRLCIASRISGNMDVIDSGVDGFLCDSLEDYVQVIKKIINEVGENRKMVQAARDKVLREFSQRAMVRKYIAVYEKALGKIGGGYDRSVNVLCLDISAPDAEQLTCAIERMVA